MYHSAKIAKRGQHSAEIAKKGNKVAMEETEPQTSENTTGIFAEKAADRNVSVLLPMWQSQ